MKGAFTGETRAWPPEARPVLSRRGPGKGGNVHQQSVRCTHLLPRSPASWEALGVWGLGGVGAKGGTALGGRNLSHFHPGACFLTYMKRQQNPLDPPKQCLEND